MASRKPMTIRLDDGVHDALAAEAEEHGRTPAAHVAALVEAALGAETVGFAGYVEAETRKDIDAMFTGHPMGDALAAVAITLARTLDDGAGMATAAVAKQLVATLVELARYEDGSTDDDDAPDLGGPAMGDEEDAEPA